MRGNRADGPEPAGFRQRPYRRGAGIVLLNAERRIFVGQRIDSEQEAWQMPQGGVEPGEDAKTAALRELEEEIGVPAAKLEILAEARDWLRYDLPADVADRVWCGRYRGQEQKWFAARFLGRDADVNIATAQPEFRAWRWASASELPRYIVPFKRALYLAVLEEFESFLA